MKKDEETFYTIYEKNTDQIVYIGTIGEIAETTRKTRRYVTDMIWRIKNRKSKYVLIEQGKGK